MKYKYKFGKTYWIMVNGEGVKRTIFMITPLGYVFLEDPTAPPLAEEQVFETKQQAEQQLSRALMLIAERI